jgi:hypothetical protein
MPTADSGTPELLSGTSFLGNLQNCAYSGRFLEL